MRTEAGNEELGLVLTFSILVLWVACSWLNLPDVQWNRLLSGIGHSYTAQIHVSVTNDIGPCQERWEGGLLAADPAGPWRLSHPKPR
eukprot:946126-Rhodomonas_salina.1